MTDYIGLIWIGKIGTFIRWLLKGCKGKYSTFYEETHKGWFLIIDFFLGIASFFGLMAFLIEVLHVDKW